MTVNKTNPFWTYTCQVDMGDARAHDHATAHVYAPATAPAPQCAAKESVCWLCLMKALDLLNIINQKPKPESRICMDCGDGFNWVPTPVNESGIGFYCAGCRLRRLMPDWLLGRIRGDVRKTEAASPLKTPVAPSCVAEGATRYCRTCGRRDGDVGVGRGNGAVGVRRWAGWGHVAFWTLWGLLFAAGLFSSVTTCWWGRGVNP